MMIQQLRHLQTNSSGQAPTVAFTLPPSVAPNAASTHLVLASFPPGAQSQHGFIYAPGLMGPSVYQPGATTPASPATAVAGPPTPSPSPASGQAAPPSPSSGPFGPQGSPGQPYLRPNTGSSPAPSPYSTGSLQARSPAPSAGSLTPAASPSASPVVRPSTPQPVLNQHHLVQIIHPGFIAKAKQPPQILPKPSSVQNSNNKAPPPPPPPPRAAAVPPTISTATPAGSPAAGTLLLPSAGVLLQQNNGSVQLILRPSTPATPSSQVSTQATLPSTTTGSATGISTVVPPKTVHPQPSTQQTVPASQPIIISGSQLIPSGRPQQVIRFIQGTMQLPQFSGSPAFIAIPPGHPLPFPTPTLAAPPQAPPPPPPPSLPPPPPLQQSPSVASPPSDSIIKSNSLCIDSDGSEVEGSLQPPKKKPKKRKKKRKEEETKMDLANIMKLSGIGDEDDLVEESNNHSSIQQNIPHSPQSGNVPSQPTTPTQQTPPSNQLQSPTSCLKRKNVVLQQDPTNILQGLHGLHQESLALAHSQLSALIAANSGANGLSSNALANTLMSAIGSASTTGHNTIQHSQQSTSSPVSVPCQPPQQTINTNQSIGLTINSSSQTLGLNVSTQNISSSQNSTLKAVSSQALTLNSSNTRVLNSLGSGNLSSQTPLGLSLSASSTQALNINSGSQNLNLSSASNQTLNTSQSQTLHLSLNPTTTQGLTLGTNTNPPCLTLNSASQPLGQNIGLSANQGLAINSSQAQAHFHSLNSVTANQASCITLNSSNQQGISLNTSQAQFTLNSATSSNPSTPQISLNLNSGQANLAAAMNSSTTGQPTPLGISLNQNSLINPSNQSLQINSAAGLGINSHSQAPVGITLNHATQGPCLTLNSSQGQPCITINSATSTQPLGLALNPSAQVTLNSTAQAGQPCLTIPTGPQGHLVLSQLLSGGDGSKSIAPLLRLKDIDSNELSGDQLVIAHPSLLPGLLNMQITNLGGKLTFAPSGTFLFNPQPTETKQQPKPSVLVQQLNSGIRRSSTDSNHSNHSSSLGSPPPILNHSNQQRKPITPKGKIQSSKNQQFCNNSLNSSAVSSPQGTFCFTSPTTTFTINHGAQPTFSISSSTNTITQPTFTLSDQPVTTTRTTSSSTYINTTQPNYSIAKPISLPVITNKTNFTHTITNHIPTSSSPSPTITAPFTSANSSHTTFTIPSLVTSTSQQTFSLNTSSNSQTRLPLNHSKVISPEKQSIPVHNQKHTNIGTFVNLPISTTSSSFIPSTTVVTTQASGFCPNSPTIVSSAHQSSNIPSHTNIPHLVPISTSTTTSGSSPVFHNVQTIQLSAHNQKQLKSVQNQIATLTARRNSGPSEKEALHRLLAEQQRIISTGKLIHPPRCYHHQIGNQIIQLHGKVTTSTTASTNTPSQNSPISTSSTDGECLNVPNITTTNNNSNNSNSNINIGTLKSNNNTPNPNPGAVAAANAAVAAAAAAAAATSISPSSSISQPLPNTCEKGTSPLQVQVGTQTAEPVIGSVNTSSPLPVQSNTSSQTTTTLNTSITSNISTTPSTHAICSVSSAVSTTIASNSLSPRGIKRQATSPARSQICRTDLIEQQLRRDQQDAREPDTHTPFRSKADACKRLIRYHVYNEQLLSQRDLEKADEIYEEATAKHLLDKFKQMMQKYRYLLLKESMKEVNTSELIMLDRLFVSEEEILLRQLREEKELKAQETSPTAESEPYDEWEAIQKELGVYCPGESNENTNKQVVTSAVSTSTNCITASSSSPITTVANSSSLVVTTSSATALNSSSVSERGIDIAQSHPSLAASVSVQRPAACLQILETHGSPEHGPTVLPVRKRINKVKPEDDEISAQVQSAIESILNLQHSGDGYEAPGSGSKTGLLPADIDGDETRADGDSALDEAVRSIILS